MIELDLQKGYQEQSSRQIQMIEARYRKASDIVQEFSNGENLLWLDIGPNRGFGLKELKQEKGKVFVIDIEEKYLKEALAENPHVKGAVMDGRKMGFLSGCFNVISLFEVVEHMGEIGQRELMSEVYRVLAPDGLLILSTPNKIASGKRRMSPDHLRELTFDELKEVLNSGGFDIIKSLGQSFLNDKFSHNFFRKVRENALASYVYYYILPWPIRSRIRDRTLSFQQSNEVREPQGNEIERVMLVVCKKLPQIFSSEYPF